MGGKGAVVCGGKTGSRYIIKANAAGAEKFSASRRLAFMSWHEALFVVRVRPGICPGMALSGGSGIGVPVSLLSMLIRYREILTTI